MTWQWSDSPAAERESEAQDLRTKGKEKAFGACPDRSIPRKRASASAKRRRLARSRRRAFHGVVIVVAFELGETETKLVAMAGLEL